MQKGKYIVVNRNGRITYEHILVAEKALGRRLKFGNRVHHVNGNPKDNRPENLVICPSEAYHQLIHRRQRALEICGDANKRICWYCQQGGEEKEMYVRKGGAIHKKCSNIRSTITKRKRRHAEYV